MPDALALDATRRRRLPALAPAPVPPRHGRGDGDGPPDVSDASRAWAPPSAAAGSPACSKPARCSRSRCRSRISGPGRGGTRWPRICPPSRRRDDAGSPPRAPPCSRPSTPSCGTASARTASSASATRSRSTRPATSAPTATTRCPIFHDGQLIGRVDPKIHRAERRLEIKGVHFEPWFARGAEPPAAAWGPLDRDAALAGLADTLRSLATFVGADPDAITLGSVAPASLRARAEATTVTSDDGAAIASEAPATAVSRNPARASREGSSCEAGARRQRRRSWTFCTLSRLSTGANARRSARSSL